jgi:hypothetical protein
MKDRKPARGDKKAYNAEANPEYDSSNSEGESERDEEEISAYHMRIVRNSGYGYPMSGGNVDNVTNQGSVYYDRLNNGTNGEKSVESNASMHKKRKAFIFTMDSAANGNIAPWTDGLERLRDNEGHSSVVGISGGKTRITHVGYMDPIGELLTEKERKKVIPSHLFVTPKYDAQGNFVREKGRWVASDNFLDTMGMDVQRSPTANQPSVMILLSIAATDILIISIRYTDWRHKGRLFIHKYQKR